jgi:hypothetical protein
MKLAVIFCLASALALTGQAQGTKVSAYPAASGVVGNDLLLLDQWVSGTTYNTKKIAAQDFFQNTIFRLSGIAGGTSPRILLTNYYVPALLWLRTDSGPDKSAIWFGNGDLASGFNGANFLWNPTHDDPGGAFGGEIQITAPQMAIGFGQDSYYGGMKNGRRMQIGIGSGHLQWIDLHYDDDGTAATPYPGWTVPVRFQIQQQGSGCFPAIYGYQEDTTPGVGHASIGFFDDFSTAWTDVGGTHNVFTGATQGGTGMSGQHPTIRGRMATGRGWDFYGTTAITNIIDAQGATPTTFMKWASPYIFMGIVPGNNPNFALGTGAGGSFSFTRGTDGAAYITGTPGTIQVGSAVDTDLICENGNGIGGFRYMVIGPNGNYIKNSLRVTSGANGAASHGMLDVEGDIWTSGFVQTGGTAKNTTDQTITSAVLAPMNLANNVTITAGQTYKFTVTIFYQDTVTTDGIQFDMGAGTATATDTRWHCIITDNGNNVRLTTQNSGALGGVTQNTTAVGTSLLQIEGVVTPSGTGTLIPRFAQVAHTTGTLSIFHGSNIVVTKL